mmetsp:Transcript_5079/g.7495  ORF Transcript_5079/g.7495 Transcript_5079/m.7495 type:complete len:168 (+) Transcript_5079:35-538(+)
MADKKAPPGQWCYEESGEWKEIDLKTANELEKASKEGPNMFTAAVGGKNLEVKRMVVQWFWEDHNGWNPYKTEINTLIESANRIGASSVAVTVKDRRYIIEFNEKRQVSVMTQRRRPVIRTLIDPQTKAGRRARSNSPGIRPPKRSKQKLKEGERDLESLLELAKKV